MRSSFHFPFEAAGVLFERPHKFCLLPQNDLLAACKIRISIDYLADVA